MSPSTRRPLPPSLTLLSSPSPARPISTPPPPSDSSSRSRYQFHPSGSRPSYITASRFSSSSSHPHQISQSPFRYVMTTVSEEKQLADNLPAASVWFSASLSESEGIRATLHQTPRSIEMLAVEGEELYADAEPSSSSSSGSTSLGRRPSNPTRSHNIVPLPTPSPFLLERTSKVKEINFRSFVPTVQCIRPWLPFILYGLSSLGFLLAITIWKTEVFLRLDELSHSLQSLHEAGYAIMFVLIFITTIPPLPLYSTLIILSGYTFGAIRGALVSYFAALFGALAVFLVSRTFFRAAINRCLSHTRSMKRVIRAIEKRPKLLFLIRLAPYPYNMMNALLAGSQTLTLRTYTLCTALSLFKVIIHTSIGSGIHSFASYHGAKEDDSVTQPEDESDNNNLSRISKIVGIVLVVALTLYLSYVARKAVNEELGDEPVDGVEGEEESQAMLSDYSTDHLEQMVERTISNSNTINIGLSNLYSSSQSQTGHGIV